MNLPQQIIQAAQVRLGVGELAQRALLALAMLQDARGLLDERTVPGRVGAQYGIQPPLPDDHMHLLAQTGVAQQLLNVKQTARRAVDGVFGTAVAEDGARDRDFRVINIERVIGIVDGQAHLGATQRRARRGAREDNVFH